MSKLMRKPSIPVKPVSQERDGLDDADRLRVVEADGGDGVVQHGVLEMLSDGGAARAVVGVVPVAVVEGVALLVGGRLLWGREVARCKIASRANKTMISEVTCNQQIMNATSS